jgi:RimJ/RimL family protein N-acetyltransferase
MHVELRTPRCLLRAWRDDDLEPFAALNADPRVMEHFPELLSREQTAQLIGRLRAHFDKHGFGPWALEVEGQCAGFVGLHVPSFEAHFTPCVEVGWRIAHAFWGRGYATEAAREALRHGFETLALGEIVAMTVPANRRSRSVMDKLGMRHDAQADFEHPLLPEASPLRRHVLYRLAALDWAAWRPRASFSSP